MTSLVGSGVDCLRKNIAETARGMVRIMLVTGMTKDSLKDHFTYMSLREPEEEELMQSLLTPTNFGHASFRNESALLKKDIT